MTESPSVPSDEDEKKWEKWFWEQTFHHSDFYNVEDLVEAKEELDQTISVGIPTLNEEDTIGEIIRILQSKLINGHALVDEVAVIDSNSTDNTRDIAREYGADVYNTVDYRDYTGFVKGKGINLWLSLYLMDGDILCWVDADIENFDEKFIYGLLGPLLMQEDVEFSKAFYERPLKVDGDLKPSGGGRVTELTARPLLNMFFPELSYFIQPLSGEYAGTRDLLESIPFFPKYGVETGMLMDITHYHGLDRIAQVDLDQRIHHNKPLRNLRKMAFRIVQVILLRARERGRFSADIGTSEVLNMIGQQGKDLVLEKFKSEVEVKPPMKEHDEYAAEQLQE